MVSPAINVTAPSTIAKPKAVPMPPPPRPPPRPPTGGRPGRPGRPVPVVPRPPQTPNSQPALKSDNSAEPKIGTLEQL